MYSAANVELAAAKWVCKNSQFKISTMIYRAIGCMSGSSLDGLDIACVEFTETGGNWTCQVLAAACIPYDSGWMEQLRSAPHLGAEAYLVLHSAYGRYTGELVNAFIQQYQLQHTIHLVASHGHTVFHDPTRRMTAQLGDGAAIAAVTGLTTISDLRSMDVALGGQGAPVVPIGEKLLFPGYNSFLNIGGIANIAVHSAGHCLAYDVCPANRVLNLLASLNGKEMDEAGRMAAAGQVDANLLQKLNALPYYRKGYPKSLDNRFGTDVIFPMITEAGLTISDALCTYVEHIATQVSSALQQHQPLAAELLVTGGGAFNSFLVERLQQHLQPAGMKAVVPDMETVKFKEALIMALMGVLRWREAANVLPSVTGASRSSSGGALWIGEG